MVRMRRRKRKNMMEEGMKRKRKRRRNRGEEYWLSYLMRRRFVSWDFATRSFFYNASH